MNLHPSGRSGPRSSDGSPGDGTSLASQGVTAVELLVVLVIVAITLGTALPAMQNYYESFKVSAALTQIQGSVQQVRMSALKEKTPHRVLISDLDDASPNRLEIQRWSGSAFVTVESHDVLHGVDILGSGSTNSLDAMTVDRRGVCTGGNVYVESTSGAVHVATIETTCRVDHS